MPRLVEETLARIFGAQGNDPDLVADVAAWAGETRRALVDLVIAHPEGRRWLRGQLLPTLEPGDAAHLAWRLRSFEADFAAGHRDTTTRQVVRALPIEDLLASAVFFAAGNTAGPFWERIASERPYELERLALEVIGSQDAAAGETTLYLLLLDPHSPARLAGSARLALLERALSESSGEVRGVAADLLADEAPKQLVRGVERLTLDPSERVRMAAWDAYFALRFEEARDIALRLALDESAPLEPRRSAIAALSAVLTTSEIASLLEVLVAHPNPVLAEDAANILWAYHRSPVIASAAADSPHEPVREVARKLLHPETGSPAAGGSRPGAPEVPRDIYEEMLKGYERREE